MIMLSLPYFIGKNIGASAVNYIREKYPKTEAIHKARSKTTSFFAYIVRMVRIPSDIASLYMGAINVNYKRYLLGSLLGMLPHMIIYPIIGMSASDISSPAFIISLCAELAYIIITTLIYAGVSQKNLKGEMNSSFMRFEVIEDSYRRRRKKLCHFKILKRIKPEI